MYILPGIQSIALLFSPIFSLPSSTQTSITKAPASKLLTGVTLTPPRSLPFFLPSPSCPSSPSPPIPLLSIPGSPFPLLRSFCSPGSAAIQGCGCPIGGSTSVSFRSSIASVKLQSSGSGARVLERVERRVMVARNCSGRSDVGGGLKRFSRVAGGGGGFVVAFVVEEVVVVG